MERFLTNKKKLIYSVLMLFIFILLLAKCKYGFGDIDESFYLSIPYRLVQGDSLFGNEWHLSQMSSFIMYPIMKLYISIFEDTDGIILNFRYIYLFLQFITSITIYVYLNKYSEIGAMFSSFLFFAYAPFGIMALSYNSLGIILFTLSLIWYLCEDRKIVIVLSGIFYSLAVLCCPFLAIYCLYLLGRYAFEKKNFLKRKTIYYLLGIFITIISFAMFVFGRVSISDFFRSLPCILNDPEHTTNYLNKIITYVNNIVFLNKYQIIIFACFVLIIIKNLFTTLKDENKDFFLILLLSFIQLIVNIFVNRYINFFMSSLHMLAIYCYIFNKNENIRDIFYYLFVPGVIYSFCLHLSSNQEILAICSASTVSMVGASVIIFNSINSKEKNENIINRGLMIYHSILFCVLLAFRMFFNFWDGNILQKNKLILNGPEKGIYASESKANEFNEYYLDLETIPKGSKVLFLSEKTWLYLCNNYKNCSFSAWTSGINSASIMRLNQFYEINPNKIPEYIYMKEAEMDLLEKLNIMDTFKLISTNNCYIYKNEVMK